jgi:hypothetical protein
MKRESSKIFYDVDEYTKFCVRFGRVFNEADMYQHNKENWKDYLSFKNPVNKYKIPNHWKRDDRNWNFDTNAVQAHAATMKEWNGGLV